MQIKKCTSVLFVESIEPCLAFWQECLGFERTAEVPLSEHIGFAILTRGTVEVMYQTVAMLRHDAPDQAGRYHGDKSFLYLEVGDIDAVARALGAFEITMPLRETFYGAREIGYREPGGHFVTFAQFKN